jgi:glyoxylase I family protein
MSRRLLSSSDRSTRTALTACWLPAHNRSSRRAGLTAGLPARRPHRRGPRDVVDAWSPAKWLKQSPDAGAQRFISCRLGAKRRHPEKGPSDTCKMATTTAFSHVALACVDPLATERFYTTHFGFQRARVVPLGDKQVVYLKLGDVYLELFPARDKSRPLPRPSEDGPWFPSLRHLAFQVVDVDAQLSAMGADAVKTLGPLNFDEFIPGWRSVWVEDPDGNIVEISQGYVDEANPPPL